jgi:hypothetical protein
MAVRLSAFPQEDSWYSFLSEAGSTPGARTHDLPACSIVPQPTTLPRAPFLMLKIVKIENHFFLCIIAIRRCIFYTLEEDTSHKDGFPLLFM